MSDMDLATALLLLEQQKLEALEMQARLARLEGEVAALRVAVGATGSGKTQPPHPPAKARPRDSKATT